jgi:3-keto-5-aminohexanoate cleavage enzyme
LTESDIGRAEKAGSVEMDLIINLAPTGMIPTREMTPHVPLTVEQIVEDVHRAWEIGITMVHLHARDEHTGEPTYRAEVYGRIIEGIRQFTRDLVVCVSLSGRTFQEFEQRAAPLSLDGDCKPDMASLTLSSVNFNRIASVSSPDMIQALASEMKRRGVLAELEAFDVGMINYARYLEGRGLLEPPHYFNLLLGNVACAQADLLHAGVMIRDLPSRSYWSLAGIGDAQLKMNAVAIAAGGGVRVGLEDMIWYDSSRTRLASNTDLVCRIHRLADACERSVMAPAQFRELLNLGPGGGQYGRNFAAGD